MRPKIDDSPRLAGETLTPEGLWLYRGVPVKELLALPMALAARLCSVGYRAVAEGVERGQIKTLPGTKRVSRESLLAWAGGGSAK